MTNPPFLLHAILDHNPAVRKALAAQVGAPAAITDWPALTEALGSGRIERLVKGFKGNKSERAMLAALLMKAGYAVPAVELSPDFWRAWGGLDLRNKALLLALLDEDLEDAAGEADVD